jgi:hypothetical protein
VSKGLMAGRNLEYPPLQFDQVAHLVCIQLIRLQRLRQRRRGPLVRHDVLPRELRREGGGEEEMAPLHVLVHRRVPGLPHH